MKYLSIALAFLAFTVPFLHAENALEIAAKFEKEKIAAVQKYLEDNPEAEDRDGALSILVGAHLSTGDFTPVPGILQQRYDLQSKKSDANLQLIMTEIARPFIESAIVSNQRDAAKAFITKVKSDLTSHPQAAQVGQFLDQLGADLYLPGVGDTMEIAFTDLEGNEIDLAKMKDKVVLVDFWATWCGPCVAEMPNVVAAYEKYGEKGFEVIGISLDDNKDSVEKFVGDNQMAWPHYFDGKGWENELAQRFGIRSIPATFLVGKGGKIVASNLRGQALEEAIEKELRSE
jgi:thiol-disulfide isomerase/thioredoxin